MSLIFYSKETLDFACPNNLNELIEYKVILILLVGKERSIFQYLIPGEVLNGNKGINVFTKKYDTEFSKEDLEDIIAKAVVYNHGNKASAATVIKIARKMLQLDVKSPPLPVENPEVAAEDPKEEVAKEPSAIEGSEEKESSDKATDDEEEEEEDSDNESDDSGSEEDSDSEDTEESGQLPDDSGKRKAAKARQSRNSKRKKGDAESSNNADVQADLAELVTFDVAVQYKGFNQDATRQEFMNKCEGNIDTGVKMIIKACIAYANVGNNLSKLSVKRENVTLSRSLAADLEAFGVKKSSQSSNSMTLPRLMICFMPFYLRYRQSFATSLQNQTGGNLNVWYKDIIFYGCDQIRNIAGYQEFHKEFSGLISSKQAKSNKDAESQKKAEDSMYDRWCRVAVQGYANDRKIHALMQNVINEGQLSSEECLLRIRRELLIFIS